MEKKTSLEFALYRLDRAKQEQATAELLYKENKLLAANNRAYYSIFYAIRAVLAMDKVDFKRHKDVLAYFNKNFVKTEIFPRQIGRKIVLASKVREDSDYDDFYVASKEETEEQIKTAESVIRSVKEYLNA